MAPWIQALGDGAWTIYFGRAITRQANARALSFCSLLARHAGTGVLTGILEWTPAFTSVTVHADPRQETLSGLDAALLDLAGQAEDQLPPGRTWEIPACFDENYAPDLHSLAEACSLSPEHIIERMQESMLTVGMLGFMPGLPYLDGIPAEMQQPRRKTPRTSVPERSIAVAGTQCVIYPWQCPAGWHLLGRTPVPLFSLNWKSRPALLAPGDSVRWRPISVDEYLELEQACAAADWQPESLLADAQTQAQTPSARFSLDSEGCAPAAVAESRSCLEILDGAWGVSVQDEGRSGWRYLGVPLAGAHDPETFRIANALAGAPEGSAALELLGGGPRFRVAGPAVRCGLAGDALLKVSRASGESLEIPSGRGTVLKPGDVASVVCHSPRPAYLAFSGGIQLDPVLGSRSTYLRSRLGGLEGRTLQTGDRLETGSLPASEQGCDLLLGPDPVREPADDAAPVELRVIAGPQRDHFTPQALEQFYSTVYTVSPQADRMGLRLHGPALEHGELGADIPSDGIVPGAIQVPADGMPIILLSDAQTTGGYTKPCVVIRADMPLLGRLVPGDRIRFVEIGMQEARRVQHEAAAAFRRRLDAIERLAVAGAPDESRLRRANLASGIIISSSNE